MSDALIMTTPFFPSLQEPDESLGSRTLKFAVVLLVHGVLLAWLFEQQIIAVRDAVLMRMDVRVIEPPVEKPRPLPPKPKVAAPPPAAPPPVMTAAPSNAPSIGGFAVAPQPPVPREVPANVPTVPALPAPVVAAAPGPVVTAARFDADYLNNPPPVYPVQSRRRGETGRVLLLVKVTPQGLPEKVEVSLSSGHARLDEAALAAVRQWRFVPARRGQEPVSASVIVPIEFRQDG